MNNLQRKWVNRLIEKADDKKITLDSVSYDFLKDIQSEDIMTGGAFQLSVKQNSWLNKINGFS